MNQKRTEKADYIGELKIGDMSIRCFVTDQEKRLLSGRAVTEAFGLTGRGHGITRFIRSKSLKPYINNELALAIEDHIIIEGTRAFGYEAWVLPELCNAILEAHDNGKLTTAQRIMADHARILIRGMAVVGIVALVDEATGYQNVRARQALEKILEKFLKDELGKWAKRFPDEFYKEMFTLKDWNYDPSTVKRPSVIGTYTNDIVYQRLAPGVLDEIRARTPRDEKGRAKQHYHRWLTEEVGHPRLQEHIAAVIALMKAASTWRQFISMLNRALPKYGDTIPLGLDDPTK